MFARSDGQRCHVLVKSPPPPTAIYAALILVKQIAFTIIEMPQIR